MFLNTFIMVDKTGSCGKGLLFTSQQNSTFVKIKNICRRQIKRNSKDDMRLWRVENIVGKGENAGLKDFLLFSQCFIKSP